MVQPIRPKPDDFDQVRAELFHFKAIARHYGTTPRMVRRWAGGIIRTCLRAIPDDFAEQAKVRTKASLRTLYRTNENTVLRWIAECEAKVAPPMRRGQELRPVPDDFAQRAPTMFKTALRDHYRTSDKVINRWLVETGIFAKAHVVPWAGVSKGVKRPTGRMVQLRQTDFYDDAADVLRRERFPVNRCDDKGLFDPKGGFWRVGWSVLTPDELLMRADRYRKRAA